MKISCLAAGWPFKNRLAFVPALAIGIGLALPAVVGAQIVPAPPVRQSIDENGVELFTGKLTVAAPALVLGSQSNAVSYYRLNTGSGWTDNLMGFLNQVGSVMTVSIAGVSDRFTVSGTTYTSTEANGATLTYDSATNFYTYTRGDGTVARFDRNEISEYVPDSNSGMLRETVSPRGEKLTFGYDSIIYCKQPQGGSSCAQQGYAYRVASVTSNYGYQLRPSYENYPWSNPYGLPDFTKWAGVIGVSGRNLAVSATADIASQSFSYVTSGGTTSYNVTDAAGRVTSYRVSGNVVLGVTYPGHANEDVTFTYSGDAVASVAKAGSGTTTYSRSDSGNTRTVTVTPPTESPVISPIVYTFDIAKQRMTSITVTENGINRVTSYDYDSNGRLTRTTMPEGNYVQLTRDARGNVTETREVAKSGSGLADIVTTAGFDTICSFPAKCNQPNWTKDAKGNQTDYGYSTAHGGVLTVTLPADESGVRPQTRYTYTSLQAYYYSGGSIVASGQPVWRATVISSCRTTSSCAGTPDERRRTNYYGPQTAGVGNNLHLVSTNLGIGASLNGISGGFGYDAVGNVVLVDGPSAGTVDQAIAEYDATRLLLWKIGPDPDDAGPALYPAAKYTYRADGQIDYVQSGTVTTRAPSGMSSFVEVQRETTGYDAFHRPIRQKTSSGGTDYQVTDIRYDGAGRLKCTMVRMDPTNWGSLPPNCNPTQTAGPNGPDRVSRITYDALSRVAKLTSGYGTTEVTDDYVRTFTGNGKLATLRDAENNLTTYEYDGHDRQVKTRFPVATKGANQSSTTDYEQITYDANRNVETFRTRRGETIQLVYDDLDRLITKIVPERSGLAATHTKDVYFGYDLLGDMTYARFDNENGEGITNTYSALGSLTSATSNLDGTTRTLNYDYDTAGRRFSVQHPDGNVFNTYRYSFGGLQSLYINDSWPLLRPVLESTGRLNRVERFRTPSGDWLAKTTSTYDGISRLASLATDVTGTGNDTTTSLAYNPAGQIATSTRTNDLYAWTSQVDSDLTYTADGRNRYTGTSFGYDANGNLTSDSTNTFVYDVENRLVTRSGAASATLRYDPLGRLYEVVKGSTTRRFLYDGTDLVAEYDASGVLQRRYVHGTGAGDDPMVWFEGSTVDDAARRYLFADERGSIVAVTDSNGTMIKRNNYDEYGVPGSANLGAFQYTGQMWLPELGMYYYKARMYSPLLGRFMQTDPIGYGDGMNLYSYAHDDPATSIDPSGTCGYWTSEPHIDIDPSDGVLRVSSRRTFHPTRCPRTHVDDQGTTRGGGGYGGGGGHMQTIVVNGIPPCENNGPSSEPLIRAANAAYQEYPLRPIDMIWPFSVIRGSFIHSFFRREVAALGPPYTAADMVSYRGGVVVPYGTPGSVRPDATVGPINQPTYVVELKSGFAVPSASEIAKYRENLPAGTGLCAIVETPGPGP